MATYRKGSVALYNYPGVSSVVSQLLLENILSAKIILIPRSLHPKLCSGVTQRTKNDSCQRSPSSSPLGKIRLN